MRYAAAPGATTTVRAPGGWRPRPRPLAAWLRVVADGVVGAFAVALAVALWPLFGRRWMRWGALDGELRMVLPRESTGVADGADDVAVTTRAITIHAAVARVWPWLLQLGQNRGGFYSYEALQNLIGCRVRNLDRIVDELQTLRVGDRVVFHPRAVVQRVTGVVDGRALEIGGWWSWAALPAIDGTRLVVRTRIARRPGAWGTLGWWVVGGMHFVMERKMLTTIRRLAERA